MGLGQVVHTSEVDNNELQCHIQGFCDWACMVVVPFGFNNNLKHKQHQRDRSNDHPPAHWEASDGNQARICQPQGFQKFEDE